MSQKTTWAELFPEGASASERRANWNAFVKFDPAIAAHWENCENHDCVHFDNGWCLLQNLPSGLNPYLSTRTGMPGMACMGVGFTKAEGAQ